MGSQSLSAKWCFCSPIIPRIYRTQTFYSLSGIHTNFSHHLASDIEWNLPVWSKGFHFPPRSWNYQSMNQNRYLLSRFGKCLKRGRIVGGWTLSGTAQSLKGLLSPRSFYWGMRLCGCLRSSWKGPKGGWLCTGNQSMWNLRFKCTSSRALKSHF